MESNSLEESRPGAYSVDDNNKVTARNGVPIRGNRPSRLTLRRQQGKLDISSPDNTTPNQDNNSKGPYNSR